MSKLDEMREWANRLGLILEYYDGIDYGGRKSREGDTHRLILSSSLSPDAAADIIERECMRFLQCCGELRGKIHTDDADSSPADAQGLCVEGVVADAIICLED